MSSAGFMQSFQTANSRRTFILSNWDKFKKNVWLFERCWVISTYFHYQLEIASVYSVYYTKKKKIEQLKILRQICFDSPAMQSDEGLLPRKPPPQSRCALCDDTLWNCNHYWNHLIWTQLVVPNKDPSDRSGQICALFPLLCRVLFRGHHLCLQVVSMFVIIVVKVTLWNCNNHWNHCPSVWFEPSCLCLSSIHQIGLVKYVPCSLLFVEFCSFQ